MLRNLEPDGLYLPTIKPHSLDKIIRHNYYARVFASSMKKKWPQRAYIGLFSGPGRARLEGTGEIVETSALGALRLPDLFTHYIFVDKNPECTDALARRAAVANPGASITVITGDVNEVVGQIAGALPRFSRSNGLISFCFVDPFAADLRFATIRDLARFKMDFLILLMLGRDVRTNFRRYYEDPEDTRIAELIDCPNWRDEYRRSGERVVRFLLRKFDEAMIKLGYKPSRDDLVHQVKIAGKNGLPVFSGLLQPTRAWADVLAGHSAADRPTTGIGSRRVRRMPPTCRKCRQAGAYWCVDGDRRSHALESDGSFAVMCVLRRLLRTSHLNGGPTIDRSVAASVDGSMRGICTRMRRGFGRGTAAPQSALTKAARNQGGLGRFAEPRRGSFGASVAMV